MKKLLMILALAAMTAGQAAETEKRDALDIRPDNSQETSPMAVEWQNVPANEAALKAATAPEVLATFVQSEAAATALLDNLRGAYATDGLKMWQIAAVSQFVMLPPGCCPAKDACCKEMKACADKAACCKGGAACCKEGICPGRVNWVKALLAKAESSKDNYVKMFCLDQLRWCACPKAAERVLAIGKASGDKAVLDFAEMVARELTGKAIGL